MTGEENKKELTCVMIDLTAVPMYEITCLFQALILQHEQHKTWHSILLTESAFCI